MINLTIRLERTFSIRQNLINVPMTVATSQFRRSQSFLHLRLPYLSPSPVSMYSTISKVEKEHLLDSFLKELYPLLQEDREIMNEERSSRTALYQDEVLRLLRENQHRNLDASSLKELQTQIESLTLLFDDAKTLHHLAPDLLKLLLNNNSQTAKDFLKNSGKLKPEDFQIINNLRQYTLEVIIVYTLSSVFNCLNSDKPAARVSTLVEQLDSITREQGKLINERLSHDNHHATNHIDLMDNPNLVDDHTSINEITGSKEKMKKKKSSKLSGDTGEPKSSDTCNNFYRIGSLLVEYLLSIEMIAISSELDFVNTLKGPMKRKGKYYIPRNLYVICNFDLGLLPIKLNLPMVCPPRDWDVIPQLKERNERPVTISDLTGGYLSSPISDFYFLKRFNLLSSHNLENFNIELRADYVQLVEAINYLQKHGFEINKDQLDFLTENNGLLTQNGLLMPKFLARVNTYKATDLLRKVYLSDDKIKTKILYSEVLSEFLSRIQRARYEEFVFKLADAYAGYKFYLPAFLDFRGRLYRSGILHFHERDLARSLIVFSHDDIPIKDPEVGHTDTDTDYDNAEEYVKSALASHFKKFYSFSDVDTWYEKIILKGGLIRNEGYIPKLLECAKIAREPFQFISKILVFQDDKKVSLNQLPITQDASASAYQIISLLLLDDTLAYQTNLLPPKKYDYHHNRKNDIYVYFYDLLLDYFKDNFSSGICEILRDGLDIKMIKSIMMPLVYGKSQYSIYMDIFERFSDLLTQKESQEVAKKISEFFKDRFPQTFNLMSLIRDVAWMSAALNKPVFYCSDYYTTVQDYLQSKAAKIWIYDRLQKKRRQVTLRIPQQERDRRKTNSAVFANFIHQKDANIAISMILRMKSHKIPIYTVHDNFISPAFFAHKISDHYVNSITVHDPLYYINSYIMINVHVYPYTGVLKYSWEPINEGKLRSLLINRKPKNLNSKNDKLWNSKIESFLSAYTKYVLYLCDHSKDDDEEIHKTDIYKYKYHDRWKDFSGKVKRWVKFPRKNILHV